MPQKGNNINSTTNPDFNPDDTIPVDVVIPKGIEISHCEGESVEVWIYDPTIDSGHVMFPLSVAECVTFINALDLNLQRVKAVRAEFPDSYKGLG